MRTIITSLLAAGCVVVYTPADAQISTEVDSVTIEQIKQQALNWQYGLTYSQAVSQGELRNAYDSLALPVVGYGFSAQFAYYMDPVPVVIGGEIGVHFFGARERVYGPNAGDPLRRRLEMKTQNFALPILAYARFQPNLGTWAFPYVEALGGTMIYSSVLTVRQLVGNNDTTGSNTESEGGANWTYGVGAGMAVKIADMIELPNSLQRFLLDIRFRYLWGSSVNVSHIEPNDVGSYDVRRVSVNAPSQIVFQLGFIVQM